MLERKFGIKSFRILKWLRLVSPKYCNQLFLTKDQDYETIEDVFLRHYGIECYRSTLMKTYQKNQERITGDLKSQISFVSLYHKLVHKDRISAQNLDRLLDRPCSGFLSKIDHRRNPV